MNADNTKKFSLQIGETKPFSSIDEQINILRDRGLTINDEENAKAILKRTSYYRLSGYSLPFRQGNIFQNDTTMDLLYEIYRFDDAFRKLILSYTSPIEVAFRSYISYEHTKKYNPLGYMNSANFANASYHASFIKQLEEDINRSDDVFVTHHKRDKGCVFPMWVAIECCSFGELSKLYNNLITEDQNLIADLYCRVSRKYISNWLHASVYARNIAAHNGRFYGRWLKSVPVRLPNKAKGKVNAASVFAVIYAINRLLPTDELAERLIKDLQDLYMKYPNAEKNKLGFPDDWISLLQNNR